jgi:hypothetical protein
VRISEYSEGDVSWIEVRKQCDFDLELQEEQAGRGMERRRMEE